MNAYTVKAELSVPNHYWTPTPEKRQRFVDSIAKLRPLGRVKPEATWRSDTRALIELGIAGETEDDATSGTEKLIKIRAQIDAEIAPADELHVWILSAIPIEEDVI